MLTRFEYDVANQLTVQIDAAGRTTYTFDAAGNQQVVLQPSMNRTTTTWNYENQPTVYEAPTNALVTMTYNPENRRTSKETVSYKNNFIWDVESDNILLETDDFNVTQVVYTNDPFEFGSLVSQRRSSTTNWYHFDALGSTRDLTNGSETITDSYLFDAWGNQISSTGTTVNPFRWTGNVGYYWNEEVENYYIRARAYQPILGRWLSRDPIPMDDAALLGGLFPNSYMYADNNPAINTDPSGLQPAKGGKKKSPKLFDCKVRTCLNNIQGRGIAGKIGGYLYIVLERRGGGVKVEWAYRGGPGGSGPKGAKRRPDCDCTESKFGQLIGTHVAYKDQGGSKIGIGCA